MSEVITLEVPEAVAERARAVAAQTQRPVEDVLLEWLGQAAMNVPVELLSDAQVLALRDLAMDTEQQETLSILLARQREGQLTIDERCQLDALMTVYRRGMQRKAEAMTGCTRLPTGSRPMAWSTGPPIRRSSTSIRLARASPTTSIARPTSPTASPAFHWPLPR